MADDDVPEEVRPKTEAGGSGSETARPLKGVSRREFIGLGSAGAASLVVGGVAGHFILQPGGGAVAAPQPALPLRFFNQAQAQVITAMAERIFPGDEQSPGATEARVMSYIDGQLAGGWGGGERMYRSGPFAQAADTGHGWQYPSTPAQAYRDALAALAAYTQRQYHNTFDQLTAQQQDDTLTAMEAGKIDTFKVPTAKEFFTMFRENVLEGLFGDPVYGGNHNMVGWKWVGFPGDPMAYGDPYARFIDKYKPYNVQPKSLQ